VNSNFRQFLPAGANAAARDKSPRRSLDELASPFLSVAPCERVNRAEGSGGGGEEWMVRSPQRRDYRN